MTKKILMVVLWLAAYAGLVAADAPARRYTPREIEAAIRAGQAGAEFAERAKKMEELHISEIRGEDIPYQIFWFSDFASAYTLLVEGDGKFAILCRAIGGGRAESFTLQRAGGKVTLNYRYTSGSGRVFEHRARYVVGSGAAEDLGERRDVTEERTGARRESGRGR